MRDESVRSRRVSGPGAASLRRLSVGGRGRGEGDVLRRRALFGRAFASFRLIGALYQFEKSVRRGRRAGPRACRLCEPSVTKL